MTIPTLTRAQAQLLDRRAADQYGLPGLLLMENAGRGVADALEELWINGPVVICCGKGNNAGDGFVIARHLDLRGYAVRVLLWADPSSLSGDAGANYRILHKAEIPIQRLGRLANADQVEAALDGAAWIVDALLGTGAQGKPRPPLDMVIPQLNASGLPILAVDVPSGLDCDTGLPSAPTIRAAHTCTFVAQKSGFLAWQAAESLGQVQVLDVGAPRKLVEEILGIE